MVFLINCIKGEYLSIHLEDPVRENIAKIKYLLKTGKESKKE